VRHDDRRPWRHPRLARPRLAPLQQHRRAAQLLINQWTFRGAADRRIDFVFNRRPADRRESLQVHTVMFNEAGAADLALTGSDSDHPYSDHRAVWTRLR